MIDVDLNTFNTGFCIIAYAFNYKGAEPKNVMEVFNVIITISGKKETILELSQAVVNLYEGMDDSLQFKSLENSGKSNDTEIPKQVTTRKMYFRGVACPMNFVKTKIELATLKSGDILEIFLDDGEPIENEPGSIKSEGYLILTQKQILNYWLVTIQKA